MPGIEATTVGTTSKGNDDTTLLPSPMLIDAQLSITGIVKGFTKPGYRVLTMVFRMELVVVNKDVVGRDVESYRIV